MALTFASTSAFASAFFFSGPPAKPTETPWQLLIEPPGPLERAVIRSRFRRFYASKSLLIQTLNA